MQTLCTVQYIDNVWWIPYISLDIFCSISTVENAIELQFKIDNIPFLEPLADPDSSPFKALASSLEKKVSVDYKRKQDSLWPPGYKIFGVTLVWKSELKL